MNELPAPEDMTPALYEFYSDLKEGDAEAPKISAELPQLEGNIIPPSMFILD